MCTIQKPQTASSQAAEVKSSVVNLMAATMEVALERTEPIIWARTGLSMSMVRYCI